MKTTLGRVAARLRGAGALRRAPEVPAWETLTLTAITTDSHDVHEDTLFCAVRGESHDGHSFLPAAVAAGAAAVLVEEPVPDLGVPQLVVTAGRFAAAHAAAELYADPWHELTLIGVTGTNGKTTTVAILRHLLARRVGAASIGTLGIVDAFGSVIPETAGLTTPGPVEIARWLSRLRRDGVHGVAMEVSSHALDQDRVAAVRFDAAILTNLSRDHLDYHGSFEAYRDAKLRLLGLLKPGCVAVVNVDDAAWKGVADRVEKCVRFGMGTHAEVRAENVAVARGGMEWELHTPDGWVLVHLPLYGSYNVANALAAAAALWSRGWAPAEIAAGLATVPQVPGRLEAVPMPAGAPKVLIDYAHTPDALARALAAIRPLVSGRLLVVFGAGGDRDRGKRPEMGRVAALGADLVIVTSDNPRTEDPERIIDDIEMGMGDAPRRRVADRIEAIRCALAEAEEDDLILLAGKGHETYQICGTEKRPFDERQIVRALLDPGVNV